MKSKPELNCQFFFVPGPKLLTFIENGGEKRNSNATSCEKPFFLAKAGRQRPCDDTMQSSSWYFPEIEIFLSIKTIENSKKIIREKNSKPQGQQKKNFVSPKITNQLNHNKLRFLKICEKPSN